MTALDFQIACRLAFEPTADFNGVDDADLEGIGEADFQNAIVSQLQAALFLRRCCMSGNGNISQQDLRELRFWMVDKGRVAVINSVEADRQLLQIITTRLLQAEAVS